MCNPKISVITVCRNALPALQRTVTSVREQIFSGYEYIIVDGDSTDGTFEWLQMQDGISWISEPDLGIYDAMNKGVQMAKGEWIVFLNAGDTFYASDVLAIVVPYLRDGYGLVYGDISKEYRGRESVKLAEEPHNAHRMLCCHQALFTRTELLRATPFDISHPFSADFKFVKQMYLRRIAMKHIPIVVSWFDTHGVSSLKRNEGLEDNIRVIREVDTRHQDRFIFIFRLRFTILWNRLRHLL